MNNSISMNITNRLKYNRLWSCVAAAGIYSLLSCVAAAQDFSTLIGRWKATSKIEGNSVEYLVEFKGQNKMQFWMKDPDSGETYLYVAGRARVLDAGPFRYLKVDRMKVAESADTDAAAPIPQERNYIIQFGYRKFFLGRNFGKDENSQDPQIVTYRQMQD